MPHTLNPDLPPLDGDAAPTAPFAPPPPAEPERTPFTTLSPQVVVPALLVLGQGCRRHRPGRSEAGQSRL